MHKKDTSKGCDKRDNKNNNNNNNDDDDDDDDDDGLLTAFA